MAELRSATRLVKDIECAVRTGPFDCPRCGVPRGVLGKLWWWAFGCDGGALGPVACYRWHRRQKERLDTQ